jgi:hypothetical protein
MRGKAPAAGVVTMSAPVSVLTAPTDTPARGPES